jgi:hypothetical protein
VGAKAVRKIWGEEDRRPDALVANNDDGAISAVEELVRLGFDVPGKVSVTGFDDIGPCLDVKPHLTTVRQPHLEIGEAAIEILLNAMKGVPPQPGPVTVPGAAVFRRSCGCSSSEAEAYSRAASPGRNVAARPLVMERLQQLIDKSLASEDPDIFLDGLEAAVSGEDSPEPLYELWQDRLKGLFASASHGASAAVSRLYQAGLQRLGNATNAIERSRAARTRSSYNILNGFFSRSAFTFDAASSGDALVESLPQLGIRDFVFCLYLGTAERARVQRVLPEGSESGLSPGDQGSPRDLVMRFMEERTPQSRVRPLVLMRLHHDGSDLGFVVCGVASPDGSLYLTLQSQLSNRLKGNALLETVRDYSRELETRV